jgi:hypothetical protein
MSIKLNTLAAIIIVAGLGACSFKYRLSPLSNGQNIAPPPAATRAPNQTKEEFTKQQDGLSALYTEPYVPAEVFPYVRGKIINVYDQGKVVACFTSVEQPCRGKFVTTFGETIALAPNHTCWLSNPPGFVRLRIINRSYQVALERLIQLPPPATLRQTLTEIGDTAVRAVIESSCRL